MVGINFQIWVFISLTVKQKSNVCVAANFCERIIADFRIGIHAHNERAANNWAKTTAFIWIREIGDVIPLGLKA